MGNELKRCPFCGSEAHLQDVMDSCMCFVVCLGENCWCAMGENYDRDAMPDHKFFSREDAIAAWNTRPEPSTEAMRKALELAEHKLDQFLQGQYNEPPYPSLGSLLTTVRAAVQGTEAPSDPR